jgi:hypothetical protein
MIGKEKKYKEQLVPKMNRPASVLAFEVGQLKETNKSLNIFLASLGLRKRFCKTLITQVSLKEHFLREEFSEKVV